MSSFLSALRVNDSVQIVFTANTCDELGLVDVLQYCLYCSQQYSFAFAVFMMAYV